MFNDLGSHKSVTIAYWDMCHHPQKRTVSKHNTGYKTNRRGWGLIRKYGTKKAAAAQSAN